MLRPSTRVLFMASGKKERIVNKIDHYQQILCTFYAQNKLRISFSSNIVCLKKYLQLQKKYVTIAWLAHFITMWLSKINFGYAYL